MNVITIYGSLKAPVKRIISMAPSITEQLFYLGMGQSIVGVTRQCNYPSEIKGINVTGSFLKPDKKLISELNPDAIIGLNSMHQHTLELLDNDSTGIILLEYNSVQDVLEGMEGIAALSVEPQTATERVDSLKHRLNSIKTLSDGNKPIRTLFLISENPIIIPSRSSYQYDALRITGAVQMPYNNTQYERVTIEQAVYFDPEIILACGRHHGTAEPPKCQDCAATQPICQRIVEDIITKPGWRETSAAKKGNIVAVPCHWLCRPGERLISGMESIVKIFQQFRSE